MINRLIVIIISVLVYACGTAENKKTPTVPEPLPVSSFPITIENKETSGWEITNFGPQGPVFVSGDKIVLGAGDGCTGITWKGILPETNYQISLEAMRVEGNDFFCGLTFPAGKAPCTLILGGWGGTTVGLSSIDGLDASDNETNLLMKFENGRWYSVSVMVTQTSIVAHVDSIKVVDFSYAGRKLSVRPEVELSRPFGIASWRTTAAVRNIRITALQ